MKQQEYSSLGLAAKLQVPASVEEFELNAAGPGATAPKLGACLDEANNNIVYRGALAVFRSKMLRAVEIVTGLEREKKPAVSADGKERKTTQTVKTIGPDGKESSVDQEVPVLVYKLSEAKYFGQVCAKLDVEEEHFQSLADVVIAGVGSFDKDGKLVLDTARRAPLDDVLVQLGAVDLAPEQITALETAISDGVVFDASAVEREAPQPKKTGKDFLAAADNLIKQDQASAIAAKLTKILGRPIELSGDAGKDREVLGKAIQDWDFKKRQEERKKVAADLVALEV